MPKRKISIAKGQMEMVQVKNSEDEAMMAIEMIKSS